MSPGRPPPPQPTGALRPGLCVAQVLGSFGGGGAERLAFNLAVGVAEHGTRSLAVALRHAGAYADSAPAGVELVELGASRNGARGLIGGVIRLRRLVRERGISVLHVHGTTSLPFVVLATRGLASRPRVVFTWQDSERVLADSGWRQRRMVWALRRCASVSGSSQKVADALTARGALENVGIFHGGVPVTPIVADRSTQIPTILWLGRMVPTKDPQSLVRAIATLRAEGLRFRVRLVGAAMASSEWYFQQTRGLVEALGLSDVISMPGFVPDDEMASVYAQSDIGVQTSHTEGLSLALMEQMMAGLAIVATDVGDTSVPIVDGRTGILVPVRDDVALVAALRRLLTSAEFRVRLGRAARERAERDFSVSAMTARAMRTYERVSSGPS